MSFRRKITQHDILEQDRCGGMQQNGGALYDLYADLIDGRTICLADFKGMVLLIVNTASKCGFTPQYAALEELYRANKERGFAVLGFPCNQFGAQEPGSNEEIAGFCAENYGVSFPIFSKIDVNGPATHPLYRFLKRTWPGLLGIERIKWNFTKFLVDRSGGVAGRFAPGTKPIDLAARIETLLNN